MMSVRSLLVLTVVLCVASGGPARFAASEPGTGEWPMWGGTPDRNMVSNMKGLPGEWDVQTKKNVKWVAELGSQSYRFPRGHPKGEGLSAAFVGSDPGVLDVPCLHELAIAEEDAAAPVQKLLLIGAGGLSQECVIAGRTGLHLEDQSPRGMPRGHRVARPLVRQPDRSYEPIPLPVGLDGHSQRSVELVQGMASRHLVEVDLGMSGSLYPRVDHVGPRAAHVAALAAPSLPRGRALLPLGEGRHDGGPLRIHVLVAAGADERGRVELRVRHLVGRGGGVSNGAALHAADIEHL